MRKQGYIWLLSDLCMYILHVGDDDFSIIMVWVDDILIFVMTIQLWDKTIADIEAEWEVTNLGEPLKIMGIEITQTPDSIAISYIESILCKEEPDSMNSMSTLLDLNIMLVLNPEGTNGSRSNSFTRLLRELQYIANAIHPDITYIVNRLASYTVNLGMQHNMTLKQILR